MSKTCTRCKTDKPLDEFNLKKNGKYGRRSTCKGCLRQRYLDNRDEILKQRKEQYELIKDLPETRAKQRIFYERNKKYTKEYRNREYVRRKRKETCRNRYIRDREKVLAKQKAYRLKDPIKYNERKRLVRLANRETRLVQERRRQKEYRARNLQYRLSTNLRTRMNGAMRTRSERSRDLLGCPIDQYIKHLESQFSPGMTWSNYGSYWSIDHIKPCASFDLTDPEQQKACFHWSNCQPLTMVENSRKGAKIVPEPVYSRVITVP